MIVRKGHYFRYSLYFLILLIHQTSGESIREDGYDRVLWRDSRAKVEQEYGTLFKQNIVDNDRNLISYQEQQPPEGIKKRIFTFYMDQLYSVYYELDCKITATDMLARATQKIAYEIIVKFLKESSSNQFGNPVKELNNWIWQSPQIIVVLHSEILSNSILIDMLYVSSELKRQRYYSLSNNQDDDVKKFTKVLLKDENVRNSPQGEDIGHIKKGDTVIVVNKLGNWANFYSDDYNDRWLWASSLGYDQINFCSYRNYFSDHNFGDKNISELITIFGPPDTTRNEGNYTYYYYEKCVESSLIKNIEVGCLLQSKIITDVIINFQKQSVFGLERLLRLSELPLYRPSNDSFAASEWVMVFNGLDKVAANKDPISVNLSTPFYENLCYFKSIPQWMK